MTGILLDTSTGDLLIEDGALCLGDTDSQTVALLLQTAKGEWKENVKLGADARSMLGGPRDAFWTQEVKRMAQTQGVSIKKVEVEDDGTINIY